MSGKKQGSYAAKGKKPYRYSPTYNAWRRAVCVGSDCNQNPSAAEEHREAHAKQFGYRLHRRQA